MGQPGETNAQNRRSVLQRLLLRSSGKPKKAVRKLLFHKSGRPRDLFQRYLIRKDGNPHPFFCEWMYSSAFLSQPDYKKNLTVIQRTQFGKILVNQQQFETPHRLSDLPMRVLIIDSRFPNPDRDSGSIDAMNYIAWFQSLGFDVDFISIKRGLGHHSDAAAKAANVNTLECFGMQQISEYLVENGPLYKLFFLTRVNAGGAYFELCRLVNPHALLIFNPVDLHHVRELREAQITDNRQALFSARITQARELHLTQEVNATIVVSETEKKVLDAEVPGANVTVMPLYRETPKDPPGFDGRGGIGFVGGFKHRPNVDAVEFFLADVWPLIKTRCPDAEFSIVGADLPDSVASALPDGVTYLGQIAHLTAWLDGLIVTVAPLRYGAGAKGKVASSLVHGVPVVGTSIAFEGMGLAEDGAIIENDSKKMAEAIVKLINDSSNWEKLSQSAINFGRVNLGLDVGKARFGEVLRGAGIDFSKAEHEA